MSNKNIYNEVLVICDDANKFRVVRPYIEDSNINLSTLAESQDAKTALALKRAYCIGFYDGSMHPYKEDEK